MTLTLSREQVRRIDKRAIDHYGISSLVLMENAGRGCVDLLCRLGVTGPVAILCGKGNNGGDGMVIARHLAIRGHQAELLYFDDPASMSADAQVNLNILQRTELATERINADHVSALQLRLQKAAWVVDALLGTGVTGPPRWPYDRVIDLVNLAARPTLAVDVPSGLDCDTGEPSQHTVRANHTCTFVAQKTGMLAPAAQPYLGTLHVADIGVPPAVIAEVAENASELRPQGEKIRRKSE